MNLPCVEAIAKAVLYEGYLLYPYRRSSVKNQQRFNFGVLHPEHAGDDEPTSMRVECLVRGPADARLEVKLRFLHLRTRAIPALHDRNSDALFASGWQEAAEREVEIPALSMDELARHEVQPSFAFAGTTEVESNEQTGDSVVHQETVGGTLKLSAERLDQGVWKVRLHVRNTTPAESASPRRDEALMLSLISTHVVLGVERGEFISLLEPPEKLRYSAAQCENIGVWPVLVGEPGQCDTLLASPIILYDYPQIAPESAGDLFDGTEIDEILSLRILTLTDEEKREIRESDVRAREILERIESMPAEQFMKMHGAVRSLRPLKEDA